MRLKWISGIIFTLLIIVFISILVKHSLESAYLKRLDPLVNPRIFSKPNQYVLVISIRGFHGDVLKEPAISKLYKIASRVKDHNYELVLKARWQDANDPDKEFLGRYALPIKPNMKIIEEGGVSELWEYGDVAEILHIGPYSTINKSVEKLKKFMTDNEYRVRSEFYEGGVHKRSWQVYKRK